jgi:hypothetical protein
VDRPTPATVSSRSYRLPTVLRPNYHAHRARTACERVRDKVTRTCACSGSTLKLLYASSIGRLTMYPNARAASTVRALSTYASPPPTPGMNAYALRPWPNPHPDGGHVKLPDLVHERPNHGAVVGSKLLRGGGR